jgi:hypothetical protein
MKMAAFWVVAPCRLVWVYRLDLPPIHGSDDRSSTDLRNVRKLIPVYTALQPRRRSSSSKSMAYRGVEKDETVWVEGGLVLDECTYVLHLWMFKNGGFQLGFKNVLFSVAQNCCNGDTVLWCKNTNLSYSLWSRLLCLLRLSGLRHL